MIVVFLSGLVRCRLRGECQGRDVRDVVMALLLDATLSCRRDDEPHVLPLDQLGETACGAITAGCELPRGGLGRRRGERWPGTTRWIESPPLASAPHLRDRRADDGAHLLDGEDVVARHVTRPTAREDVRSRVALAVVDAVQPAPGLALHH